MCNNRKHNFHHDFTRDLNLWVKSVCHWLLQWKKSQRIRTQMSLYMFMSNWYVGSEWNRQLWENYFPLNNFARSTIQQQQKSPRRWFFKNVRGDIVHTVCVCLLVEQEEKHDTFLYIPFLGLVHTYTGIFAILYWKKKSTQAPFSKISLSPRKLKTLSNKRLRYNSNRIALLANQTPGKICCSSRKDRVLWVDWQWNTGGNIGKQ